MKRRRLTYSELAASLAPREMLALFKCHTSDADADERTPRSPDRSGNAGRTGNRRVDSTTATVEATVDN
jgi:hypothetical protein